MESGSVLVEQARDGDRRAFDCLVRAHYGLVYRIASRFTIVHEDIDDLVQETFVCAFERLHQLQDSERFQSWLSTIARNTGISWRRVRFRQETLPLDDGDSSADASLARMALRKAREESSRGEIRDAVHDAIDELPESQRRVVRLHYIEGYDYAETACLLNTSVTAVRGRLDRARTILRRELQEMIDPCTQLELNHRDLNAIRAAADVALVTVDRPDLNAFYISDGRLVVTDTHRIFVYASATFSDLEPTLIHADLGRQLRDRRPGADHASLAVYEDTAVLRVDDRMEIDAQVIDYTYLSWEQVIPPDFACSATARAGDWIKCLSMLSDHGVRMGDDDEKPHPMVLLELMREEGRIVLHESYSSASGGIGSEISLSIPAEFAPGKDIESIALNPTYLEQSIRALDLEPDDRIELLANGPMQPVMTRSPHAPETFVLTMPMQRTEE